MQDEEYLKGVLKEIVILTRRRKRTIWLLRWFYQIQIDWVLDEFLEHYALPDLNDPA